MKPEHRAKATPHLLARHQDFRSARRDSAAGLVRQLQRVLSYEPPPEPERPELELDFGAIEREVERRRYVVNDSTPTADNPAMFHISYNANTCTVTQDVTANGHFNLFDGIVDRTAVEMGQRW